MAAGPNRVTQGWRLCENAHVQGLGILIYSSFYLYKTNVWKWRLCCMEECKFITTIPSTTEMTLCCSFRSQTCSLQPHVRLHFSQFWAAALNTALRNNQRRHIWPSIYSVFTQIFFFFFLGACIMWIHSDPELKDIQNQPVLQTFAALVYYSSVARSAPHTINSAGLINTVYPHNMGAPDFSVHEHHSLASGHKQLRAL